MSDLHTDKATESVTCATCKHITNHRQASQAMYAKKHGFCGCALQPAYVYMARLFNRICADFIVRSAA